MKVLAFAASLRRQSTNVRLIEIAAATMRSRGVDVDLAEFREFDMPPYDEDVQDSDGFPDGAIELTRRLRAADGLVIASPEYNHSMPGTLKNAIDWISEVGPNPLRGLTTLLISAAGSPTGGYRGMMALRAPLECLGTFVCPDMAAVGRAWRPDDVDERLATPMVQNKFHLAVDEFLKAAEVLSPVRTTDQPAPDRGPPRA